MANGPKLTCIVSGKSRPTTWDYLKNKATRLNITCSDLMKFYVSREVVTTFNKGNIDVFDMAVPDCKDNLQNLLQEKSFDEIIQLNSRSKKSKKTVTNQSEPTVDVQVVEVESKLSPETEEYLKQKEELIGKDKLEEIHNKVWGEEEEEVEA